MALLSIKLVITLSLLLNPGLASRAQALAPHSPAAIFTVTTTADSGAGSLRQAILDANASPGLDTISFAIGAAGSQQTIFLSAGLPEISDPLIIDGWSQGGAGYSGAPLVEINGSAISTWNTTNGLVISAGNSSVRGLAINYFNIGMRLTSAGGNVIAGNMLGLALDGVTPVGNRTGISITQSSDNNRIGTDGDGVNDLAERNIISASGYVQQNNSSGILIEQGSDNHWIAGNYIGTDISGTLDRGNASNGITTGGVAIIGANGDGMGDELEGNLISGNNGHGVSLTSASNGSRVAGNRIGTDASGTSALPNNSNGVSVGSCSPGQCSAYTIGTDGDGVSDALEGNLISGNGSSGVYIPSGTLGNYVIAGNKIGVNLSGTAAIPNGNYGVHLGGDFSRLGTNSDGISDDLEANLISGNGDGAGSDNHGLILPSGADHNLIAGNLIGVNFSGTAAIPNLGSGILVEDNDNTLAGNLVAGNGAHGIYLFDAFFNTITANYIGVARDLLTPLGNSGDGIFITANSDDNLIGGAAPGAGNWIAHNGGDGVFINSGTSCGAAFCLRNRITGNQIFDNGELGIDLYPNGVNPNDALDADTGANTRQNYPVLSAATGTLTSLVITGTLNSSANLTFTLDFYSSPLCDPSGNGEGALYLGAGQVATDGSGAAAFTLVVNGFAQAGEAVSATATDPAGNTSEFSACLAAQGEEPIAGLAASNDSPTYQGAPTQFSATLTSGTGVNFAWDFGDGQSGAGAAPSHTYPASGVYTATVTASNNLGALQASTSVSVLPAPLCAATPDDGATIYGSQDAAAVQQAVDAAADGATIKIAGTCAGVSSRDGTFQTVYISTPVNLAGGYTLANWADSDPQLNPTSLDALDLGRVVLISFAFPAPTRLENLTITNGSAFGGGAGFCPQGCGGGLYTNGSLELENVRFENNQANRAGGAFVSGYVDSLDSDWLNNHATSQRGGGLEFNGYANITAGLWQNNSGLYGGALFAGLDSSILTISGTQFISNTATSPVGGSGGAVYSAGALDITNAYFAGNQAQTGGGAVQHSPISGNQPLSIVNTTFTNNTALNSSAQGGAIYTTAPANTILSSTFVGNSTPGSNGSGGAISAHKALTVTATLLDSNFSGGNGGAIYHWGQNLTGSTTQVEPLLLLETTLSANQAGGEGGGLYFRRGFPAENTPVALVDSTFTGNTAGLAGGGAYLGQPASITGSLFAANLSQTAEGGGLYSADRLSLADTIFQENTAAGAGGAYVTGNLDMVASDWLDNTAASQRGGALEVYGATEITGGLFQSNTAQYAGGVYAGASLVISATQFISNTATSPATGSGGAIYASGLLAISNAYFAGNQAHTGAGAILHAPGEDDLLNISTTQFINNTATNLTASGGALTTFAPASLISASLFQGNSAPGSQSVGGAIVAFQPITLTATTLISNSAGSDGGAIYHWGLNGANDTTHQLGLVDSWLAHNQSGGFGGGVYYRSLTDISTPLNIPIHIVGTTFAYNQAEMQGGGIYLGQKAQVEHSTFRGNTSLLSSGGGIFAYNNLSLEASLLIGNSAYNGSALAIQGPNNLPGQIINTVFAGNTVQGSGATIQVNLPAAMQIIHTTLAGTGSTSQGIAASNGNVQVVNSIIVSHTLGIVESGSASVTADHTLFHANQTDLQGTVSNLNPVYSDPLFLDAANADFHLSLGSPAVDAGAASSVTADFEADLRPIIAYSDIGADEFGDSTTAEPDTGGVIITPIGNGREIVIRIPPGGVGGRTVIRLLPVFPPSTQPPPTQRSAGAGFVMQASPQGSALSAATLDPAFLLPVEITLTYTDADLAGLDENSLILMVFDADSGAWLAATNTCAQPGTLTRDPEANQITATSCAAGEYALFASPASQRLYLPLIKQ